MLFFYTSQLGNSFVDYCFQVNFDLKIFICIVNRHIHSPWTSFFYFYLIFIMIFFSDYFTLGYTFYLSWFLLWLGFKWLKNKTLSKLINKYFIERCRNHLIFWKNHWNRKFWNMAWRNDRACKYKAEHWTGW